MNIIDLGILSIIAISVIVAIYYGFTVSLYNIGSFVLSWLLALVFHSSFTRSIAKRFPDLLDIIVYYSEGSSKIAFSDKILPVSSLSQGKIESLAFESGLPNPFRNNIEANLLNQNLSGLDNLGQYIDYTVANIILNLISFMIIFLVLQLLFTLAISIIRNVTDLPVLIKFDSLSAACLGFVRGILFLFVVFAFVPLLYLVVPASFLGDILDSSKLIGFFLNSNLFTVFVRGYF